MIELKNNAWDNMVISLSRMLTESTLEYRIPCIITLGFICEELHGKPYNMSMSQSETILTGLLFCVSETEQDNRIRLTAMKALQNSVKYYTKILEDSKAQELFFESLMFNITKTDTSVARTAIEVLLEVVRPLYQYLDRYLSVIVKYMAEIISNSVKTPSMAIIATELFGVIAVYELEIKNSQVPTYNHRTCLK